MNQDSGTWFQLSKLVDSNVGDVGNFSAIAKARLARFSSCDSRTTAWLNFIGRDGGMQTIPLGLNDSPRVFLR